MILDIDTYGTFKLRDKFLADYRDKPVPWGFGALSWVTYKRTYSRHGEEWWQTCRRVIEGMISVRRIFCLGQGLEWDEEQERRLAREAYDRMWSFKWTPPGRGLWIMGTQFMYERGGAALNNCGFVSTADIAYDYAAPFAWILEMSMLGVGVGFDTAGKKKVTIRPPEMSDSPHTIADSREGWAAALERLLNAFAGCDSLPAYWDFSCIRERGSLLQSFGGYASGPEPLQKMLSSLSGIYGQYVGSKVDSRLIVDTMNMIGRCVVAGGIRRSAQIAFGDWHDESFIRLKTDPDKLEKYRWVSNNSVMAECGMDYSKVAEYTVSNGEPGYFWLDNARAYGRMKDPVNWRDKNARGSNPCVEQTLWDRELCCLVETFPAHHENREDYLKTLEIAYNYAKTVTLIPTHREQTNLVMQNNRRLGCSITGVVQAINKIGKKRFFEWCEHGYRHIQSLDKDVSARLNIPTSIKTTSVKPSGTVSLLAGATPGVHWEHSPFYLRRIRVSEQHPLIDICKQAGYHIERDTYSDKTMVIAFPVQVKNVNRCKWQVPLREKLDLAADMQAVWSDNQVSCTAEFNPETESEQVPSLLSEFESKLKAISFLPSSKHGYKQPPYEQIPEEQYHEMNRRIKPLAGTLPHEEELEARFCDGHNCEV